MQRVYLQLSAGSTGGAGIGRFYGGPASGAATAAYSLHRTYHTDIQTTTLFPQQQVITAKTDYDSDPGEASPPSALHCRAGHQRPLRKGRQETET